MKMQSISPAGNINISGRWYGHVSSLTITMDEGATLAKGNEFGYLRYGGLNMTMLFEPGKTEFIAKAHQHYNAAYIDSVHGSRSLNIFLIAKSEASKFNNGRAGI